MRLTNIGETLNDYVGLSNPGSKDAYQNLNFDLNETNRETTSINYTASAKSFLNKNSDISQYNNMNIVLITSNHLKT